MISQSVYIRAVLDTSPMQAGIRQATLHTQAMGAALRRHADEASRGYARAVQASEAFTNSVGRASVALRQKVGLLEGATRGVMGLVGAYGKLVAVLGAASLGFGRLASQVSRGVALQSSYEQSVLKLGMIMRRQGEDMAATQERVSRMLDYARKWAAETPYSVQDAVMVLSTASPMVKGDEESLKKILDLAGLLAAKEPIWGLQGAVFAIVQALSEDYVSLQDRFNIPRATIRKLRERGLKGLALIEAAMKEMNISMELINQQSSTLVGLQGRIEDYTAIIYQRLGAGPFRARKEHLQRVAQRLEVATQEGSAYLRGVDIVSAALGRIADVYYRVLELPGLAMGALGGLALSLGREPTVARTVEALKADALGLWRRAGEWWATTLPRARAELEGLARAIARSASPAIARIREEFARLRAELGSLLEPVRRVAESMAQRLGLSLPTLALLTASVLGLAWAMGLLARTILLPIRLLSLLGRVGGQTGRQLGAVGATVGALGLAGRAAIAGGGVALMTTPRREGMEAAALAAERLWGWVVTIVTAIRSAASWMGQLAVAVGGVFAPLISLFQIARESGLIRELARLIANLAQSFLQLVQAASPFAQATVKLMALGLGAVAKALSLVLTPILSLINSILDFLQSSNPLAQAIRTMIGLFAGLAGGIMAVGLAWRATTNLIRGTVNTLADELSEALGFRPRYQSALWQMRGAGGPGMGGTMVQLPRRSILGRIWASIWRGPVDEFGLPEHPSPIWGGATALLSRVAGPLVQRWREAMARYRAEGGPTPATLGEIALERIDRSGVVRNVIGNLRERWATYMAARQAEAARRQALLAQQAEQEFRASPIGRLTTVMEVLIRHVAELIRVLRGRNLPPASTSGPGAPPRGKSGSGAGGSGDIPTIPLPYAAQQRQPMPPIRWAREHGLASMEPAGPSIASGAIYSGLMALIGGQGFIGALMFALQGLLASVLAPISEVLASLLGRAFTAATGAMRVLVAPIATAAGSALSGLMNIVLGRIIGDAIGGGNWLRGLFERLKNILAPHVRTLWGAVLSAIAAALSSDFARGVLAKARILVLATFLRGWAAMDWARGLAGPASRAGADVLRGISMWLGQAMARGRAAAMAGRGLAMIGGVAGGLTLSPVVIAGIVAAVLAGGGYLLYRWARGRAEADARRGGGGRESSAPAQVVTRPLTWWERIRSALSGRGLPPATPPPIPEAQAIDLPARLGKRAREEMARHSAASIAGKQGYRITATTRDHAGRDPGVDIVVGGKGYLYAPTAGTIEYAIDVGNFGKRDKYGLAGYGLYARLRMPDGRTLYIGHLRPEYLPASIAQSWAYHQARIAEYRAKGLGSVSLGAMTVRPGDYIGMMGNTGNSTGPHVHLGLKDQTGRWVTDDRAILAAAGLISPIQRVVPEGRKPQPGPRGGGVEGRVTVSLGDINIQVNPATVDPSVILSEVDRAIRAAQERQRRELLNQLRRELKARGY